MQAFVGIRVARAVALAAMIGGLTIVLGVGAGAASAQTSCEALATPFQFTEFTGSAATRSNSDSSGRVAYGGNASLTSMGIGTSPSLPIDTNRLDLIAGANLTTVNGGQVHRGSARYAGTLTMTSGTFGHPNGTLLQGAPPFSFASEMIGLQTLSTSLAALSQTPGATITESNPGFPTLRLVGTNSTRNVFNLTLTQAANARSIGVQVPAGATTIINIPNASFTSQLVETTFWNGSSYVQVNDAAQTPALEAMRAATLWNLPVATALSFSSINWGGTILAPAATTTFNNGQLNGSLLTKVFNGSGQTHLHNFNGCLPSTTPTPVVPEGPIVFGAAALLAIAAGVFVVRRARFAPAV